MATIWNTLKRLGRGWLYNEAGYTYDQDTDPDTGADVFYDSVGLETDWDHLTKP